MGRLRKTRRGAEISREPSWLPFTIRAEPASVPAIRFTPVIFDESIPHAGPPAGSSSDREKAAQLLLLDSPQIGHFSNHVESTVLDALSRITALESELSRRQQSIADLRLERARISAALSYDRGRLSAMGDLIDALHQHLGDYRRQTSP